MNKLQPGTITLKTIMQLSYDFYEKKDRNFKVNVDLKDVSITIRKEKAFNLDSGTWEENKNQPSVKFFCRVKDKNSKSNNFYPVTIVLQKFELKSDALIKWRTGSQQSIETSKKGIIKASKRQKPDDKIQFGFLTENMFVSKQYG